MTTTTEAQHYTATGSVRGDCGHQHRTVEAAAECVARDQRACGSLAGGAYSDRHVTAVDERGYELALTDRELDALWAWQDGQDAR